jgi:hypothetical protein
MSEQPLHRQADTHLYAGSFVELTVKVVSAGDDILVAAPDEQTVESIDTALHKQFDGPLGRVEPYSGEQTNVPFAEDSFDVAVQQNPNRGVLQRHQPLYEMTAVVRRGGTIVYRAPNYLAESVGASIRTLYALEWTDNREPVLAGHLDVTVAGNRGTCAARQQSEAATTLSEF